jgi:hypothetical protein
MSQQLKVSQSSSFSLKQNIVSSKIYKLKILIVAVHISVHKLYYLLNNVE